MPVGALVQGMFNLAGGALNDWSQAQQSELDYQRQKEFAQNSMQWKAEDAKKAGFHPLAALGTMSANYTPSASAGGGIGDALMNTGQAVGRGVSRALNPETKMNRRLLSLQVRQEELKTKALEDSLKKMGQAPQPTKAGAGTVKNSVMPKNRKNDKPANNPKPFYQLLNRGDGYAVVPSQEVADATEGQYFLKGSTTYSRFFGSPSATWNAIKKQLPPAPKGKKYIMKRTMDGWNVVRVPKDYKAGWLNDYDPYEKRETEAERKKKYEKGGKYYYNLR